MRESLNVKLMINRIIVQEEKIIANVHAPNIPQTEIHKGNFEKIQQRCEESTKLYILKFLALKHIL